MNVWVRTIATVEGRHQWDDAVVTFDTTILQVVHGAETTTFPLCNVISFTTSESVPS